MKKLLVFVSFIAIAGWSLVFFSHAFASVPATMFDHSSCQYPNRVSNPPNGCDNSDPANPQCMKDGREQCEPVKETVNVCK